MSAPSLTGLSLQCVPELALTPNSEDAQIILILAASSAWQMTWVDRKTG